MKRTSQATYVDGFVLSVPRRKLNAYRAMAQKAGKIWREYGALDYKECVADDLKAPWGLPFPKLVKPKKGEVILFSYITYRSRAHRDSVNANVMKDPRLKCDDPASMPFDCKRMAYGGFKVLVSS